MIYISHRKGLAGNRLECENRFVLGILLRTPLRPPRTRGTVGGRATEQ